MHIALVVVANGLSGECSWHRFGSTRAQPLHFSSFLFLLVLRCLVSFLSQQSDAKWSRHCLQKWCSGISPISSFQPRLSFRWWTCFYPESLFHFVVLATLNDLSYQKGQCQQTQFFPAILFLGRVQIFFRPLDNNVVVTFVSHYIITECVLASELVQVQSG
mgnify:CR=1 FL=1